MPIDLTQLQSGQQSTRYHPRDIFASLPERPYRRLRLEQGEVLNKWFDRRDERDLVIKQNTGGGKTLVGLLVAQSSLNEGHGPVVYLAPDTYLLQQVAAEATRLGLAHTEDARSNDFRASRKILIATFDKVVNGRTAFGLSGHPNPIVPGTVIIDDAHSAIIRTQAKFQILLPAHLDRKDGQGSQSVAPHKALLDLFAADLAEQNPRDFQALRDGQACHPMRVPFWSWSAQLPTVIRTLTAALDDEELGLNWSWPLVSEHLLQSTATFTNRFLEIRPLCPPIGVVPAIAQASRRIYLTATLADDGVLVTELDASPQSIERPITPERAADLGDRMILAPLALNPYLSEDVIRRLARSYADGDWDGDGVPDHDPVNVVALVPSDWRAAAWTEYANETLHVTDMAAVVPRLANEHVGLVVLVNKYDGVDLPGDACRMLIIDGVPSPLTPHEQRESAALSGSAAYRATRVQRLEQGMGRGIRDEDDYCAVLLLGQELALTQIEPASLALFSPATRAQIELSQRLSRQIEGEGESSLRDAITMFLERQGVWKELSRGATSEVAYDPVGHVSSLSIARRQAFEAADCGDFAGAVSLLRTSANFLADEREKGWVIEEVATYLHQSDATAAQTALRAAKRLNPRALRPKAAPDFRPVQTRAAQAEACSRYLSDRYEDGLQMVLSIGALLGSVTWNEDLTDEAEAGWCEIGKHLGFAATRPDVELAAGPDVLWVMSSTHLACIELKTGVTRSDSRITKTEIDQLSGSLNWAQLHYPDHTAQDPVLLHKSAELRPDAAAPQGTRVVTEELLDRFAQHLKAFAAAIAEGDGWHDVDRVRQALRANDLATDQVIERHSTRAV